MKKTIVLSFLTISLFANAEIIGKGTNGSGGELVLTSDACSSSIIKPQHRQKMKFFYSTLPGGKFLGGCWTVYEDKLFVIYDDGDSRLYDPNYFVFKNSEKKKNSSEKYM